MEKNKRLQRPLPHWRLLCWVVLLLVTINLSGCMNRKEVDKIGLLGAIAVDRDQDQFLLTMEITKPEKIMGGMQPKMPFVIVQSSGDTFFDAIRNTTNKFDRKIFLATNRIFIVSEEAARQGLTEVLDFWWRDHEARENDYLLIAKGCDASEIIGVTSGIDDIPSLYLDDLVKANRASSKSINKKTFQYLAQYYCSGQQPTLGVVHAHSKEKVGDDKNNQEIRLEGSAVFNKDKLVGFLDDIQTRSLNFATNKIKSGILVVPSIETQKFNSIEIIKSKSKLDVIFKDDQPVLTVDITLDGMLGEDQSSHDLKSPTTMNQLESACAKVIEQQLTDTIRHLQSIYGLDIFGFGLVVHRKYPERWKDLECHWDKVFAQAEFSVKANVNISKSGLYQLSIKAQSAK